MKRAAGLVLLLAACNPLDSDSPSLRRVDPAEVGLSTAGLDNVTDFLRDRVAEDAFPGGVLVVGRHGAVAYVSAVGQYGDDDARPVDETTIYDLASLTKVIGLTTAAMLLVAEDELGLERHVAHYLPEFSDPRKAGITVRHLLTHSSGLAAWAPLYLETPNADSALQWIFRSELESPPGAEYRYSDLGAIVLTQIVGRIAGAPLDAMLEERVFAPLGMGDTRFRPPPALSTRIAPTELDPWRGRVIRGEVHDENAFHLGGVSGHAGLFSTGLDLARFAIWLLDAYHDRLGRDDRPVLPASLVRQFTTRQPGPEGSTRALGWDTPTPGGGASSGHLLDPASFGHTGFTGTSIWIDPVRELFIILLTNRVHPTRENRALLRLRGIVADMVVQSITENAEPMR
ncbi:MAG: serine hydrolase [Gemmatimonadetes bacterium]|nr:serine hydrolase [Gemmatimonadota bacterium]